MALEHEIGVARETAGAFADAGEEVVGVVPAESADGTRIFLCAFAGESGERWLALDEAGAPVGDRTRVREAVAIAALCELAEESAGGGDLDDLRVRLAEIRAAENPEGIEEAEEAAAALAGVIREPPRVASPAYLDEIGAAAGRLERALADPTASPFAAAMQAGAGAAESLAEHVERGYKLALT